MDKNYNTLTEINKLEVGDFFKYGLNYRFMRVTKVTDDMIYYNSSSRKTNDVPFSTKRDDSMVRKFPNKKSF